MLTTMDYSLIHPNGNTNVMASCDMNAGEKGTIVADNEEATMEA